MPLPESLKYEARIQYKPLEGMDDWWYHHNQDTLSVYDGINRIWIFLKRINYSVGPELWLMIDRNCIPTLGQMILQRVRGCRIQMIYDETPATIYRVRENGE